jgi:flavin-dependent dehydrogenase
LAGKIPPAKVLVVGGGVAGLSAIATARNLVYSPKENIEHKFLCIPHYFFHLF